MSRHRCLIIGCNPHLKDAEAAADHKAKTGHRVAKWPVRSAEGKRRARERNETGYYDKYNVGAKSREARGHLFGQSGYGEPRDDVARNPHEDQEYFG